MRSSNLTVFFAHAGGNATSWSKVLPYWDGHRTLCVERPGRGMRSRERAPSDISGLIKDQAEQVISETSDDHISLVGHSFGGGLAWLVARELLQEGRDVKRLVISAAASNSDPYRSPTQTLDDDSLIDTLIRSGGVNPAVCRHAGMRALILNQLRQDYDWKAQFREHANSVLDIPSLVVIPLGDSFLTDECAKNWRNLLSRPRFVHVPGGHFAPISEPLLTPSKLEGWFENGN